MDIISYLLKYLQQSKEVGIANLGTFFKKKFPGRYDKDKQAFLPPGYTLQFSSEIKQEENFVNFIAEKENISADNAQNYINKFVEDINNHLELEHEVELNGIGRLFFTEQGLNFESAKDVNYGSEFFGLPILSETESKDDVVPSINVKDETVNNIDATSNSTSHNVDNQTEPIIENIVLDEVKDDFKNTLERTDINVEDFQEVPPFIVEQHAEHPNRFGHQPESEKVEETNDQNIDIQKESIIENIELDEVKDDLKNTLKHTDINIEDAQEVPPFIVEQHEEHPNRFGHQPESEQEENTNSEINRGETTQQHIVNNPESTAGEPTDNSYSEILSEHVDEMEKKSIWPKIFVVLIVLFIIGAIIYYLNPTILNQQNKVETKTITLIDTLNKEVDSVKIKQDSIAKTDSILKASQVQNKIDSTKNNETPSAINNKNITFEVIGASYKTIAGAEKYIRVVKTVGINAKIVKIHGPRHHISIGSFKTQKEAEENLIILQKKLKGKDFYIQQIVNTQP